jgi:hypothetical protein
LCPTSCASTRQLQGVARIGHCSVRSHCISRRDNAFTTLHSFNFIRRPGRYQIRNSAVRVSTWYRCDELTNSDVAVAFNGSALCDVEVAYVPDKLHALQRHSRYMLHITYTEVHLTRPNRPGGSICRQKPHRPGAPWSTSLPERVRVVRANVNS